ncbi:uncharacterized protein LOC116916897 isoform X1 [Daphnia magna]|uniref:uncharacterized protein LOC116916897 isoform X1 n=2 Tax=Daphnia magna TaxID=35525 RepID=UPI001E1BC92D|nr:uncharacterized protein LOC116916897 isoform X1 [Daphnia magna]
MLPKIMANDIFFLSLALFVSLSIVNCEVKESLFSTFSEKSFRNDKSCIDQVHDKLSEFLLTIEGPEKANRTSIHGIGKDAQEIINKIVNGTMYNCNGISLEIAPFVVTHLHKDGRNFYVEQLTIQKILIKPILILNQTDVREIPILEARINETMQDIRRIEKANEKQSKELDELEIEIIKLEKELRNVTAERDVQAAEGLVHHNAFHEVNNVLLIEKKKYNELKGTVDYIVQNACRCRTCRINQNSDWTIFLASRFT